MLAAHSYGGLVARLSPTSSRPTSPGWCSSTASPPSSARRCRSVGRRGSSWNTTRPEILDYPDYERVDFDQALDEIVANRSIPPMPLVVLTADEPYPAPTNPDLPADIATVTREAQDVSQRQVAQLVPGAEHITETHSGHDIMLHNPVLVSDAIIDVVDAVRDGRTSLGNRPDVSRERSTCGDGRQIYVECRGEGSPTVVLIAGKGNGAEDWQQVLETRPIPSTTRPVTTWPSAPAPSSTATAPCCRRSPASPGSAPTTGRTSASATR